MSNDILSDSEPLELTYLPDKFIDRTEERDKIRRGLPSESGDGQRAMYIHGPRGTGKSHLLRLLIPELPTRVRTCLVSCIEADTQYKVLQQVHQSLTGEAIQDGYHTSDLQRAVETELGVVPTVLILDEIDFLLHSDDDDLLYYLSRLDHDAQLTTILVSSTDSGLQSMLERRTYSSLHPKAIEFDRYSVEEMYNILATRARDAFQPRSVQQQALRLIASSTASASFGLQWLNTAAMQANQAVTKSLVEDTYKEATDAFISTRLADFTVHHRLLYQSVSELLPEDNSGTVRTGQIYDQYEEICSGDNRDPLSERRISDYLKHLEFLGILDADYHYGGNEGKTRKMSLNAM